MSLKFAKTSMQTLYAFSMSHQLLDTNYSRQPGISIGNRGCNLTISFLSMNRVALSVKLLQSIEDCIPDFAGQILIIDNGSTIENLNKLKNTASGCLDSVRNQTIEINSAFVVDDGSTDRTREILFEYAARWPALRVIQSDLRGVSHARNLGIAASEADFVAFLDSDDLWLPRKLELQMALFNTERDSPGFVHCACTQIDEFGQPLAGTGVFSPSKRGNIFEDMVRHFYHISGSASAVVVSRELVNAVGGFDESISIAEDKDLWMKLAQISDADYVPDALVELRSHSDTTFSSLAKQEPEFVLFQKLKIWNRWYNYIAHHTETLDRFRREVRAISVGTKANKMPDLALYEKLASSGIQLAEVLFPDRGAYIQFHQSQH